MIVGGGGYVGTELTKKLIDLNYNVGVYDLFLYGNFLTNRKCKIFKGDVRDIDNLKIAIRGYDTIIHLACISNDPSFELNRNLSKSINYDCFEPLIKISKDEGIKKFIFASSSSVYGIKKEKDVHEDLELKPLTDYSKFKVKCEDIVHKYSSSDFTTTILRPSTVNGYSERQRLDVVVNIMTNIGFHTKKIKVFGGSQLRPNIFMGDMIDAYILLIQAENKMIQGEVFNVGDENISVSDIAKKTAKILSNNSEITYENTDDLRSYHVSSDRIKKKLGFVSKYSIDDGIKSLIHAFENKLITNTLDKQNYYNLKTLQNINFK